MSRHTHKVFRFDPPIHLGKALGGSWRAMSMTHNTREPRFVQVDLDRVDPGLGVAHFSVGLDLTRGEFLDPIPAGAQALTKKAIAKLTDACLRLLPNVLPGNGPLLDRVAGDLRTRLLARLWDLETIAEPVPPEPKRPQVVREVEEILRSRTFGCYTEKVAELCCKLTGHKISCKPQPPKPWPTGAFLVMVEDRESALSSRLRKGETVFAVGGVRGFGSNIFSDNTGIRTDGTVGGNLDTESARPATRREIERFISKATARALVVLAEILDKR